MRSFFPHIKTFYRKGLGVMVVLWLAVIYSSVNVSFKAYENRQLLNQLNDLKKTKLALDIEYGQLLIEESMLSIPSRIEPEAEANHEMIIPDQSHMIYLTEYE